MADEPISAADAANLVFDSVSRVNAFVIAGELGPGGFVSSEGDVDIGAAREMLAARAARITRLGQRPDTSGRTWWWRDTRIVPEHHVRVVDSMALSDLAAQRMITAMDHAHPLWEVLFEPRVAPGRAGMLVRIHHSLADGLAAATLMAGLADAIPPTDEQGRSIGSTPEPSAHRGRPGAVGQWTQMFHGARIPRGALLGEIRGLHAVRFGDVDLDAVAAGARSVGATVNDAVLSAAAAAIAAGLRALGEQPPTEVRVSVPIAVDRHRGEGNALTNVLVSVPLRVDDGDARLATIHSRAAPAIAAARRGGAPPAPRGRLMMRLFMRYADHQRIIGAVSSSLRGPRTELRFGGAPLLRLHPVGTLGGNVRTSVVAVSYSGCLSWGLHTAAPIPADTVAAAFAAEMDFVGGLARR